MLSIPKKTLFEIVNSGNHYLAAVKGNQPKLYEAIQEQLLPQQTFFQVNKGHGRKEKRQVSIYHPPANSFRDWPALATIIRVCSERQTKHKVETETRYYISDLTETAEEFANRIRGYWGVENKVHYVRFGNFWRRQISDSDNTFGTNLDDRSEFSYQFISLCWI